MRIEDLEGKPLYIMMSNHGVNGVAVQTTHADIQNAIRDVKRLMKRDKVTQNQLKQIHANLAEQLKKMAMDIARHGNAISSTGEFYDKQTYDNDLVACAIYDHIANGKPIAITDNIGPGPGSKIHE
jgi:hypothetical protein